MATPFLHLPWLSMDSQNANIPSGACKPPNHDSNFEMLAADWQLLLKFAWFVRATINSAYFQKQTHNSQEAAPKPPGPQIPWSSNFLQNPTNKTYMSCRTFRSLNGSRKNQTQFSKHWPTPSWGEALEARMTPPMLKCAADCQNGCKRPAHGSELVFASGSGCIWKTPGLPRTMR